MLSKFTTCGVGFIVAVVVFIGLGALGRSHFREYVPTPAVRVLRSVPFVADVNGIRMPITVDMALKIGLTKPVTTTVSIGSTEPGDPGVAQQGEGDARIANDAQSTNTAAAEPEVAGQTGTDSGMDYLVDEMGIPYDVRIEDGTGVELVEWHANRDSTNDITFSAAFKGDTVGKWVTFDVTYYDDRGRSLGGVMDSSKNGVYNPIAKQTLFEFTCEDCVESLRNAEFYAVVIR